MAAVDEKLASRHEAAGWIAQTAERRCLAIVAPGLANKLMGFTP